MLSYGYTLEDVDWILKNLSIEKENEKCLEKEIYSKLERILKHLLNPILFLII